MKKITPIRHSDRAAFKQCPRKLYWRKVVGIKPKGVRKALEIGSAFHAGLEVWRQGQSVGEASDAACDYVEEQLGPTFRSAHELEDEQARLRAYLAGYAHRYRDDLKHDWHFEYEAKTPQNTGTIDAWYKDEVTGLVWIVDDKTRSQLTNDLHLIVRMDEQLKNYALLLQAKKKGDVAGVILRETNKATIKRTKKEDGLAYAERVMARYQDGNDTEFLEVQHTFKPGELEAFEKMRNFENERMKANCASKTTLQDWPYNYNACAGKYGNCEFLHACTGNANDTIYTTTEEGALDDGEGRKRIFGYDPGQPAADDNSEPEAGRQPADRGGGRVSSAPV